MPTHHYKCKECGKVFEVFRHFSELGREMKCANCRSGETERVFTIPHIQGETVAGSSIGGKPAEIAPGAGVGRGRGLGQGRGLGGSDGRGVGRMR
jgi:putative FmdB family regulatory protein